MIKGRGISFYTFSDHRFIYSLYSFCVSSSAFSLLGNNRRKLESFESLVLQKNFHSLRKILNIYFEILSPSTFIQLHLNSSYHHF